MLTTNLPFSEWPTIFPYAGSAIALIDRLLHHAEIISIDGDSYRRGVAEAKRKLPPQRQRAEGSRSEFPRFLMSRNTSGPGARRLRHRAGDEALFIATVWDLVDGILIAGSS